MPHISGAKFPYEGQPPKGIEPGTFGCHEALQLARSRAPDRNGGRDDSGFALAYFAIREQVP